MRNEASVAMLLRSTSCRHLAACAGTSLSSLRRVANCVTCECDWSALSNNTRNRCPQDVYCLAQCNRSSQLISASAFQRQSLDADTLALFLYLRPIHWFNIAIVPYTYSVSATYGGPRRRGLRNTRLWSSSTGLGMQYISSTSALLFGWFCRFIYNSSVHILKPPD